MSSSLRIFIWYGDFSWNAKKHHRNENEPTSVFGSFLNRNVKKRVWRSIQIVYTLFYSIWFRKGDLRYLKVVKYRRKSKRIDHTPCIHKYLYKSMNFKTAVSLSFAIFCSTSFSVVGTIHFFNKILFFSVFSKENLIC